MIPFIVLTDFLGGVSIFRTRDNAFIPVDDANSDYKEYLQWLAAGSPAVWPPVS